MHQRSRRFKGLIDPLRTPVERSVSVGPMEHVDALDVVTHMVDIVKAHWRVFKGHGVGEDQVVRG